MRDGKVNEVGVYSPKYAIGDVQKMYFTAVI